MRTPGADGRDHRARVWVALGVIVAAGVGAFLARHVGTSLWFDEIITLEEATRASLEETWYAKVVHPPLVRVLVRGSLWAFGDHASPELIDLALRLPGLLMGAAAIVVIFLFARAYADGDARVGLVAAAAWALLPYGAWYSSEARFYAALVLFSAWTLYALGRLLERARLIDVVHLTIPLTLGCYTHYLFGFVFLLSALAALTTTIRAPRRALRIMLPWLFAGLAYLPWVAHVVTRLHPQNRSWSATLFEQLHSVPINFFLGRIGYYRLGALRDEVLLGATFLLCLGLAIHLTRRGRARRLTALVLLPALIAAAALHHSLPETPFFHPKYLAFVYPFVCLALGEVAAFVVDAWRDRRGRGPRWADALVVLALASAIPVGHALADVYGRSLPGASDRYHRQQYAQAAAWIAARRGEGELVVILECSRAYNQLAFRHYGVGDPIARLPCREPDAPLPAPNGRHTFVVLTHWGRAAWRDAALARLHAEYGASAAEVVLRGLEGQIIVHELAP